MQPQRRTTVGAVLALVMIPFAVLAVLEILAFAPASAWLDPRVWLVQLFGAAFLAVGE